VVHGDARGRTIGFPTANINLKKRISPLKGVYAVKIWGLQKQALLGVANLGTRPTVKGKTKYLLETHIFDFNQEIYGQHLGIEFIKRIRDEKKFNDFNELKQQIEQDGLLARKYLF